MAVIPTEYNFLFENLHERMLAEREHQFLRKFVLFFVLSRSLMKLLNTFWPESDPYKTEFMPFQLHFIHRTAVQHQHNVV